MAEKVNRFDKSKAEWSVPTLGVLNGKPIHSLEGNALFDSSNVVILDSMLQPRPGMTQFQATVLTGRPTGAFHLANKASGAFQTDAFQNDAFQVASNVLGTLLIVGTTRKLYIQLSGGIAADITGTPDLTAQDANLARFTSIQIGTPLALHVIHVNGVDIPRKWNTVAGLTFVPMTEDPGDTANTDDAPRFSDVTTISDRVIGIIPPYDIRWGEPLNLVKWAAGNNKSLADTPDELIAISNFGLSDGAVYKSNSIWKITVTGNDLSSLAFRFDYRKGVPGPASPAALVNAEAHYYMTNLGRIARWDGYQFSWVADGVWPLIKADLDTEFARQIHGVYKPITDEVWFYYPRIGDAGECKGLVVVRLPNPEEGLTRHLAFVGVLGLAVSASMDTRLSTQKVIVFTSATPKSYTFEGETDDGVAITGFWQTGLAAVQGPNPARIGSIETFADRGPGYGSITIQPVYSDQLDNRGGHIQGSATVNLTVQKPFDLQGVDVRGRFLGVRYTFSTPATLKWKGVQMVLVDRG